MVDLGADYCYDFYHDFNSINDWQVANTTCANSGLVMVYLDDHAEYNLVTNYLYNTGEYSNSFGRAGVWMGYQGISRYFIQAHFLT